MKYQIAGFALAGALLAACATPAPVAETPAEAVAAHAYDYDAVFAQDDRPAKDYDMYAVRKASDVLDFTGVAPGMTVVEMEAGDGFYTELLSRAVGADGRVFMQNPPSFAAFLGDSVSKRVDGRLGNVKVVQSSFDNLSEVPDEEADMVTWFLGPHELWYTPEDAQPFSFGDPDRTFPEIARVMKPGATLVILDHMAPAGSPATTGGDTHRIDKSIILDMAGKAGLTLVAESDLLANPDDDHSLNVFDPAIRRKTDRFLLKFTK